MKNYEEIHVSEEQTAIAMVPALEGQMAIVYLDTIKRLASYLPKANWTEIRDSIISKFHDAIGLEALLEIMEEELKFHKSVNMINEFEPEQIVHNLEDETPEYQGADQD